MAAITSLPNEVLVDIFERLRDEKAQDLLSLHLTCRKLQHAARQVLYCHICLAFDLDSHSPLSRLMRSAASRDLIRSFRLIGFLKYVLPEEDRYFFDTVCRFITSLSKLRTFSLNLDHIATERTHVFPSVWINLLLRSLPPTVVNLELDTNGCDDIYRQNVHLCPNIRRLLPQLEVLRLRVSQLCMGICVESEIDEGVRVPNCPQLRMAVIQISLNTHWYPRVRLIDWRPPTRILGCSAPDDRDGINPAPFSKNLRAIYEAGTFPRLQAFLVMEDCWVSWRDTHAHNFYRIHNVVNNTTITTPHAPVYPDRPVENLPGPINLVYDLKGDEFFLLEDDFSIFMEGNFAWKELPGGARLPPTASRKTYKPNFQILYDRSAADARSWTEDLAVDHWHRERLTGCRTLRMTIEEGLEDFSPPEERYPAGWAWTWKDAWHVVQTP